MSSFLDLPDELILKVLSHTEIAALLSCGQVSKRIRTISNDNSLFQMVNLSNKNVKTDLLATLLNKGCKSLNLSGSSIWGSLNLIQKSQLRKLDLSYCNGILEELLASCDSLQNLSLKGLKISSNMMDSIYRNSQTLQVINLYNSCMVGCNEILLYNKVSKHCKFLFWGFPKKY